LNHQYELATNRTLCFLVYSNLGIFRAGLRQHRSLCVRFIHDVLHVNSLYSLFTFFTFILKNSPRLNWSTYERRQWFYNWFGRDVPNRIWTCRWLSAVAWIESLGQFVLIWFPCYRLNLAGSVVSMIGWARTKMVRGVKCDLSGECGLCLYRYASCKWPFRLATCHWKFGNSLMWHLFWIRVAEMAFF